MRRWPSILAAACLVFGAARAALAETPPPPEPDDQALPPPDGARPKSDLQVAADPAAPRNERRGPADEEAAGPRLSWARVFTRGISPGWSGRMDSTFMSFDKKGTYGISIGLEGWGSPDGGGGGAPMTFFGGSALKMSQGRLAPRFLTLFGAGFELLTYDRVQHTGQFGIFAPMADVQLGFDFRGVMVLGRLGAEYRWGWGGDDRSQIQAGMVLFLTSELWDGGNR